MFALTTSLAAALPHFLEAFSPLKEKPQPVVVVSGRKYEEETSALHVKLTAQGSQ